MKQLSFAKHFSIIILIGGLFGCAKSSTDDTATPELITTSVTVDLTGTTVYSGGFVTSTYATAYGVCYSSSNPEPTLSDTHTSETVNTTTYNSTLTGLTPNTIYYLRAYATYSTKTGYGAVIKFNTGADVSGTYGQVSTFAGNTGGGFLNGNLRTAQFNNPMGITADAAGNLYVADSFNSAIRKIATDGSVTTIAGTGSLGYVNGEGSAAQFYSPSALAVDAAGNVYVADRGNNAIRKITPAGMVSSLAGNGQAGYADGTGSAATFNTPSGIAIDASGNLIIADSGNNLIRKVTPAGVVTTLAGSRTVGLVNGTGTAAYFNKPTAITIDAAGNIYVAEPANHDIRIIDADALVTSFSGAQELTFLGNPNALSIDANGNLWICDANSRVLKLTTEKKLYIMAGTSGTPGTTDGAGNAALFNGPTGIVATNTGVYISDFGNNVIRKIQ